MITEDYVSFETAKLLKEKGFNEDSWFHYDTSRYIVTRGYRLNHPDDIPAWTLQMAMKWLREEHNIHILPQISDPSQMNPKYYIVIWTTGPKRESYILELFNSYEEAVEEGIKYCLENLI